MSAPYEGKGKLKNHKHEMFAKWYAVTLNGVQSAIKAGLGGTYGSSAQYAGQLLKDTLVQARIGFLIQQQTDKVELEADNLVKEIAAVAFGNVTDVIKMNKAGTQFTFDAEALKTSGAFVQEISVQGGKNAKKSIKCHDKMKALDMLMQYHELYNRSKQAMEAEKHVAYMADSSIDPVEVDDDGFLEALNDVAGMLDDDSFVRVQGKDDGKQLIEE